MNTQDTRPTGKYTGHPWTWSHCTTSFASLNSVALNQRGVSVMTSAWWRQRRRRGKSGGYKSCQQGVDFGHHSFHFYLIKGMLFSFLQPGVVLQSRSWLWSPPTLQDKSSLLRKSQEFLRVFASAIYWTKKVLFLWKTWQYKSVIDLLA